MRSSTHSNQMLRICCKMPPDSKENLIRFAFKIIANIRTKHVLPTEIRGVNCVGPLLSPFFTEISILVPREYFVFAEKGWKGTPARSRSDYRGLPVVWRPLLSRPGTTTTNFNSLCSILVAGFPKTVWPRREWCRSQEIRQILNVW